MKSLKKISNAYLYLSTEFAKKSKIFDAITIAEKIDIDYEMKMTTEFNFESINKLNTLISKYLENAEKRITEIETIIKNISEI